ncbi:unnamed protein product [Parnassius apollo]|uniref:(apollo) hypothetical protein n=1 Tax=Parnassius apollo TaxID=110799 RepID=A0A8S3WTT4_PARAO|nr:unnamed protein product [Parnassius apollo]
MNGEPEELSDTTTNCNFTSTSEAMSDINQAKLDTLEKKAVHLRLVLEKDFKAADFKWSLFVAAAFSFRYESCLRPFPPAFIKNGVKDMDELLNVLTDVPALDLFLQQLDDLDNLTKISDIIDLLFYVLVRLKEPSLKTVPAELYESILAITNSSPTPLPQYIFQVCYSKTSHGEQKWKEMSKNYKTFYAYHGSRLENVYSMMHFGIQQQMCKNTALGSGLYLSPDLNVSLPHSHGGFGWGASCIGGHLSCIAMCEVIDTPDGINVRKPITDEGDGVNNEGTNQQVNSTDVKASYYVTNSDLLRLRYLLVYAKQPTSIRFSTTNSHRHVSCGTRREVEEEEGLEVGGECYTPFSVSNHATLNEACHEKTRMFSRFSSTH